MLSADNGVVASSPSQRVPYSTPVHTRPTPQRPSTVGGAPTLPIAPSPPPISGRRGGRPRTGTGRDRPPRRGDAPEAGLTPSEAEWSDAAGFVVASLLERGRATPRSGARPQSSGAGGFVNLTAALLQACPPQRENIH